VRGHRFIRDNKAQTDLLGHRFIRDNKAQAGLLGHRFIRDNKAQAGLLGHRFIRDNKAQADLLRHCFILICTLIAVLMSMPAFAGTTMANDNNNNGVIGIGDKIERYVDEHMETTAGMSVAIFDEHQTIYRNYFGYTDVKNKIPVAEETVMEWGSVSKLLVWVSVMQLKEQGLLDLDADIRGYLPEGFLRKITYDSPITILHLMNHTAGFEESFIGIATGKEERIIPLDNYLSTIQPVQKFEPGTVCAYSNWGTALTAYIVECASGLPYDEYVRLNIFEPLGMHDTSIRADMSDNEDVKKRRLELKIYTTNVHEITPNMSYIIAYPAGMCISTLKDMQTFAQSLLSENTILFQSKETYYELFTPSLYYEGTDVPRNYHGFWSEDFYGTRTIGHGGNTAGCSSYLLLDLEKRIGTVIQTNQYDEKIYNMKMPELLFGAYAGTSSDYTGLTKPARAIYRGPLKLSALMATSKFDPEDTSSSYDIRTKAHGMDRISRPYGDHFVIGIKDTLLDIVVIGLYLLSVIYSLINILRYVIGGLWRKIKGKSKSKNNDDLKITNEQFVNGARNDQEIKCKPFEEHNQLLRRWSAAGTLLPLIPVAVFLMVNSTLTSFQQWPVFAYKMSFLLIFITAIVLFILVIWGFIKIKNSTMKKSRRIYLHSINICMIITIINTIYWQWGMFWVI
jgi:CubicO group peptidase (beta-lactamase class C family)